MILGPGERFKPPFALIGVREEFSGTIVGEGEWEQVTWGRGGMRSNAIFLSAWIKGVSMSALLLWTGSNAWTSGVCLKPVASAGPFGAGSWLPHGSKASAENLPQQLFYSIFFTVISNSSLVFRLLIQFSFMATFRFESRRNRSNVRNVCFSCLKITFTFNLWMVFRFELIDCLCA